MKVSRYFLFLGSPSIKRGSRGLVFDCCLPTGHILHCRSLPRPYTPCYLLPQTLFLVLVKLYLVALFLWYPVLAGTYEIHCLSSTWQVTLACTLTSLLYKGLGRVQRTCSQVFCFFLF